MLEENDVDIFDDNYDIFNDNYDVFNEDYNIFDNNKNIHQPLGKGSFSSYPKSIKLIKLIVSHSNSVIPNGPFEYIINNVQQGNNTIQINDINIVSAINNSQQGYTFDINVQTIYKTYDNAEVVVNNFSQYIK